MPISEARAKERREQVGSDSVVLKGDSVVVHAACEMPEWKATPYRRAAVVFGEKSYFVASRTALLGGAWRYVLTPWPVDLHDQPGVVIHYDAAYVLARDEARRGQARIETQAIGLFFVTWFLGFLFSGAKLSLNQRYGIHPVTVTEQSVFIQRVLFLALSVLLVFAPATGIPIMLLLPAVVIILGDLVIRSDRLFKGGLLQYGFCEWLFRRFPK